MCLQFKCKDPRHESDERDSRQEAVRALKDTGEHWNVRSDNARDVPVADLAEVKETLSEPDVLKAEDMRLFPLRAHLRCELPVQLDERVIVERFDREDLAPCRENPAQLRECVRQIQMMQHAAADHDIDG